MASWVSGLRGLASYSISAGAVMISLVKIGKAASCIKKLYEDWTCLQQHPRDYTSKKIMILMNGTFPCLEIASELVAFYNWGFEQRHLQVVEASRTTLEKLHPCTNFNYELNASYHQGFERKSAQAVAEFHKTIHWVYPLDLPPAEELETQLQKWLTDHPFHREVALVNVVNAVKSYREINALFEKLHWISLVASAVKHFLRKGSTEKSDLLPIAINSGYNILRFRAKANCDYNLSGETLSKLFLNIVFTVPSYWLTTIEGLESFRDYWFPPKPIQIGRFSLIRFNFPSTANESCLYYLKIPERYHDKEPFCHYICCLRKLPVTRTLFILDKDNVYLFEKEALITYIFELKVSKQPLVNPISHDLFKIKDVYEDLSFNAELTAVAIQLKDKEKNESKNQSA